MPPTPVTRQKDIVPYQAVRSWSICVPMLVQQMLMAKVLSIAGRGKVNSSVSNLKIVSTIMYTTFAKSDACLATDPDDPTKIYCALNEYNKITCIDLTKNPEDSGFETDVCGIQGPGAYQDGHVSVARLNNPQQILSMHDPETGEKVIYICDANNNCVRMYNMETKLMSTVAGIGGKSGYAAGNPTVSRMNRPYGICITPENDIYVADAGNKVIMKLAFM